MPTATLTPRKKMQMDRTERIVKALYPAGPRRPVEQPRTPSRVTLVARSTKLYKQLARALPSVTYRVDRLPELPEGWRYKSKYPKWNKKREEWVVEVEPVRVPKRKEMDRRVYDAIKPHLRNDLARKYYWSLKPDEMRAVRKSEMIEMLANQGRIHYSDRHWRGAGKWMSELNDIEGAYKNEISSLELLEKLHSAVEGGAILSRRQLRAMAKSIATSPRTAEPRPNSLIMAALSSGIVTHKNFSRLARISLSPGFRGVTKENAKLIRTYLNNGKFSNLQELASFAQELHEKATSGEIPSRPRRSGRGGSAGSTSARWKSRGTRRTHR